MRLAGSPPALQACFSAQQCREMGVCLLRWFAVPASAERISAKRLERQRPDEVTKRPDKPLNSPAGLRTIPACWSVRVGSTGGSYPTWYATANEEVVSGCQPDCQ